MNSEELEQSLKTEFEGYLKTVLAEMKQETTEFQGKIEAEFEKQKAQIDEAFKNFSARFNSERTFDAPFLGSVGEHLRLARDEGARIAADAMVEAENLGQSPLAAMPAPAPVEPKYDAIRDAVADICSKDSQSSILKSLVHHASNFAPRGAFFIIKSEHFSGWKVFGADDAAENSIRDILFPVASDTILGAAVSSASSVDNSERTHPGDLAFTNPLQFGQPEAMFAVPLIARGRGVAVLYADKGENGEGNINREALETIVRVAGMTVELLASMQTAKAENRVVAPADFENVNGHTDEPSAEQPVEAPVQSPAAVFAPVSEFQEPVTEPAFHQPEAEQTYEDSDAPIVAEEPVKEETFSFSDSVSYEGGFPQEVSSNPFDAEPTPFGQSSAFDEPVSQPIPAETSFEDNSFAESPYPGDEAMRQAEMTSAFDAPVESFAPPVETTPPPVTEFNPTPDAFSQPVERFEPVNDVFASPVEAFEPPQTDSFAQPVSAFEPVSNAFEPIAEPAAEDESKSGDMIFDSARSFDAAPVSSPFEQPKDQFEPAAVVSGGGFAQHVAEPTVMEAPVVKAPQPRLSDRNVDLPIEVSEEERRIHNDARRFARLLVSEIKLYNEKKVTEGREASDLYDRLREAIDRSREMYDKRVQPPVAAKFDYFHYEIVNSLAEGKVDRLGSGYPGATV